MPGLVHSIERAAAILRLLSGSGGLTLTEISGSVGLAKGTAHGILRTLQHVGFVEQDRDSGRYRLAATPLGSGGYHLDLNELRSRAINWADALAAHSGEEVRIGALAHGEVLVVHHVFRPDDSVQTVEVGSLLPAHACALGKVLLAYDASAAALAGRSALASYTRRTITARPVLTQELRAIRTAGWSADVEEMIVGKATIAAPIRSQGGLVVGAVGISGEVERVCDTRRQPRAALVKQVCDAAEEISGELTARRR